MLKETKTMVAHSTMPAYSPTRKFQPVPSTSELNVGEGKALPHHNSSDIDFTDPYLCQMEINRLIRENQKLTLQLRESEFSTKTFFMSHIVLALIAVLLLWRLMVDKGRRRYLSCISKNLVYFHILHWKIRFWVLFGAWQLLDYRTAHVKIWKMGGGLMTSRHFAPQKVFTSS